MKTNHTFGVHFITRANENGSGTIYARIVLNKSRAEICLKQKINPRDWNVAKGIAKPKNEVLKQTNNFLEEVRAKLVGHYQQVMLEERSGITADNIKSEFLGLNKEKESKNLPWLCTKHNTMMSGNLKKGSLKNYFTTERYILAYLTHTGKKDVSLESLKHDFIHDFEYYIRNNPLKEHDACTNNGTMKHLERLKKMINWAVNNEWLEKDPFKNFKLRYKRTEREFLREDELQRLAETGFAIPMIQRCRDIFLFSCYTGLSFIDMSLLKPYDISAGIEDLRWIKTARTKTGVPVNVPILGPAQSILDRYYNSSNPTVFPKITNQEINRNLKIIAQVCGIQKNMTFHLARHTFATTVTLTNGVPIESISKMLGHTKLATTMIYAKVSQHKIGAEMAILNKKLISESKR